MRLEKLDKDQFTLSLNDKAYLFSRIGSQVFVIPLSNNKKTAKYSDFKREVESYTGKDFSDDCKKLVLELYKRKSTEKDLKQNPKCNGQWLRILPKIFKKLVFKKAGILITILPHARLRMVLKDISDTEIQKSMGRFITSDYVMRRSKFEIVEGYRWDDPVNYRISIPIYIDINGNINIITLLDNERDARLKEYDEYL